MRPALSATLILALLAEACGSGDVAAPSASIADTLIVSDAAPAPVVEGAPPDPTTYTYASLPFGSIPRGAEATVRNRATGAETHAPILDGAVDPVRLPAATGDTVELSAVDSGGTVFEFVGAIKARVPPVVVRSSPGMGATDSPSLLRIDVVFSEPVTESTVDENTVTITLRNQPVPGRVGLSEDGLVAVFIPEDSLVPGSTYTIRVSRGVRDRTGDALAEEYRADFTVVPPAGVRVEFRTVSAGTRYTCAVSRGGEVYCWGQGEKGQLGAGALQDRPWPTGVALPSPAVGVEAGEQTTCAATETSRLFCWGSRYRWSPGPPGPNNPLYQVPAAVLGDREVLQAAVGGGRMCGVDRQSFLWCVGGRPTLGGGGGVSIDSEPGTWLADQDMTQVSLGLHHDCYVDRTGTARCMGTNLYGQLGLGTFGGSESETALVPNPVSGGLTFSHVTTGNFHTCGLAGTAAQCWGLNADGQLGIGADYIVYAPVPVAGNLQLTAIDAGALHTCGLTGDGVAWCWGDNRFGQLGDGSRTQRRVPVAVGGGLRFRSLSAGFDHTCGVSADDALYCWGANDAGQLGDGSRSDALWPIRVADRR